MALSGYAGNIPYCESVIDARARGARAFSRALSLVDHIAAVQCVTVARSTLCAAFACTLVLIVGRCYGDLAHHAHIIPQTRK